MYKIMLVDDEAEVRAICFRIHDGGQQKDRGIVTVASFRYSISVFFCSVFCTLV